MDLFLTKFRIVAIILGFGILNLLSACNSYGAIINLNEQKAVTDIDKDVLYQLECGPRLPGSKCHNIVQNYIRTRLEESDFLIENQQFSFGNLYGLNIIGKFGNGTSPIIIGAHYDTRFTADRDPIPSNRSKPVPGANDGASGVALLLDLSRRIKHSSTLIDYPIWLVFFDLEDNGGYPDWEWILGSSHFANSIQFIPKGVIIVDMIGDEDLQIYYEINSTPELREQVWKVAGEHGYSNIFIPEEKYRIIDDHIPFLEMGFPAIDIIDFDYPYWHTTLDTYDKVSANSIKIVSDVIYQWIINQ